MPERKKLIEGFKKFKKKYYEHGQLMKELAENGASPDFFIIHCIDPRSGAGKLFDSDPGQIFGDRVMAAFVPEYEKGSEFAASLTYAITFKNIKHIIVLGHTECGGIEALVKGNKKPEINDWMNKAHSAFERAKRIAGTSDTNALCRETEKQAIIVSMKNLMSYPGIKKAFDEGKVSINGWLFDLKKGDLLEYKPGSSSFQSLLDDKSTGQHIRKKNGL
jgi:carbonic anhydrase